MGLPACIQQLDSHDCEKLFLESGQIDLGVIVDDVRCTWLSISVCQHVFGRSLPYRDDGITCNLLQPTVRSPNRTLPRNASSHQIQFGWGVGWTYVGFVVNLVG